MSEEMSNFEQVKLAISIFTPITVLIVGFFLNQRLKSIDNAQWQNRKIVEKRLELYDEISPKLNLIFCFLFWVGYWKEISPKNLIETKRDLDRIVNIYRHLLSEDFYEKYNDFIHIAFETYIGTGKDALIKSHISNSWGDRRSHTNYGWDSEFDNLFVEDLAEPRKKVVDSYNEVMEELRACIGIDHKNVNRA